MAALGFDWPDLAGPLEKVREETTELERAAREADGPAGPRRIGDADAGVAEEAGDLLFAAVNAARLAGVHPANALLGAIGKFERRCRRLVEVAERRGITCETADLATLDAIWDEIKASE